MKTRRILTIVLALLAGPCISQSIYKCPDTNGRLALQDTPCAGGAAHKVAPAAGADPRATSSGSTSSTEMGSTASLKASVGLMEWERKGRDLSYELRDAKAERERLDYARDSAIASIEREFRVTKSQLSADMFAAQQQARITNVRLDYQNRTANQDAYIRSVEEQRATHAKADPRASDDKKKQP